MYPVRCAVLVYRYSDNQVSRIPLVGELDVGYLEVLLLMNCMRTTRNSVASGRTFLQTRLFFYLP
jgi:hypothetical protein